MKTTKYNLKPLLWLLLCLLTLTEVKVDATKWRNTSLDMNGSYTPNEFFVWGTSRSRKHPPSSSSNAETPAATRSYVFPDYLHVFLRPGQLVSGEVMPFYFRGPFPSYTPAFLSEQEAAQIPFNLKEYDATLTNLSITKNTTLARAVYESLRDCENLVGRKFCATSYAEMKRKMEKLMDSKVRAYQTAKLPASSPLLQNYTISKTPTEIEGSTSLRSMVCHMLPNPYAVWNCHRVAGENKAFRLSLIGEDGVRLSVVSVCHYSSSEFSPKNPAFSYLGSRPGDPVCHILHPVGFLWVPTLV